jgi:hypothetical protein
VGLNNVLNERRNGWLDGVSVLVTTSSHFSTVRTELWESLTGRRDGMTWTKECVCRNPSRCFELVNSRPLGKKRECVSTESTPAVLVSCISMIPLGPIVLRVRHELPLNVEPVSHLAAYLNVWMSRSTESETNNFMTSLYESASNQPGVEPA